MAAYNAKFLRMISSSEPTNLVPNRPNGGFCYLFEGESISKKNGVFQGQHYFVTN